LIISDHDPFIYSGRNSFMAAWVCTKCGYLYDDRFGDPEHGVPAGTPFEKIPDSWVCPRCKASKAFFAKRKE
jgi:rubredoxin